MRNIVAIIGLVAPLWLFGQSTSSVEQVQIAGIETCFVNGLDSAGMWITTTLNAQILYSDVTQSSPQPQVVFCPKTDSWSNFNANALPHPNAAFGVVRDTSSKFVMAPGRVFFTVFDGDRSVLMEANEQGQHPQPVSFNDPQSSIHHPFLSPQGDQLFFSSNRSGGAGGYDLYYVNRLSSGWSEPIRLKGDVNTPANELFPSMRDGDIWFASNRDGGKGGLDLYFASRSSMWTVVDSADFNSAADETGCYWINSETGLFSSNRNGNDFVYRVRKSYTGEWLTGLSAVLECAGTPVQNAQVSMFNELGERIVHSQTDAQGGFLLGNLKPKQSYKVKFENAPADVLAKSLLYIVNEQGKRIMVFAPGKNGWYILEMLPLEDMNAMQPLENEDQSSLLNIAVEGQVFEEKPGDIGKGEPIYILDETGEVIALAYTTDFGRFRFDELSPEATYTFKVDPESDALRMVIKDGDEEIAIPIQNGEAVYERIKGDDQVMLNNEHGAPIVIRKSDVFVIQNIYYELNSSYLTAVAKSQLLELSKMLKNNPDIAIELSSHTDSRGEEIYNQELSEKRARSAVDYLVSIGIAPARMTFKGYGESKLLNNCSNNANCSEEEHAVNRRTEIRVLSK